MPGINLKPGMKVQRLKVGSCCGTTLDCDTWEVITMGRFLEDPPKAKVIDISKPPTLPRLAKVTNGIDIAYVSPDQVQVVEVPKGHQFELNL